MYHVDLATQRIIFASDAARRNLGYTIDELRELSARRADPGAAAEGRLDRRIAELRASPAAG